MAQSVEKNNVVAIKRINQSMITENIGQLISIVGELHKTLLCVSNFMASDKKEFKVIYKDMASIPKEYETNYIEIRGIPDEHGNILYESHQAYGNKFNMELWNKFVVLSQQYPNLF